MDVIIKLKMSDGNGTPDSWEQTTNSSTDNLKNDVAKKISTLNVNAAEFVPNFGSFGAKPEKNTSGSVIYYHSVCRN